MTRKLLPSHLSLICFGLLATCATSPPPRTIEPVAAAEAAPAAEPAPAPPPPAAPAEPPAPAPAAEPPSTPEAAPPGPPEPAAATEARSSKSAKRPAKKKTTSSAATPAAPAPAAPAPAPAAPAPAPPKYTGDNPCKGDVDPNGPIGKACARGGTQAAKTTMKELTRKGRAAGVKFECDDCHKDDSDYSRLNDNAHRQLDKLLAAVK